jgi:tetratricopeptide (TPR) repeat protein
MVTMLKGLAEPPASSVAEAVWRRAAALRLTAPATFLTLAKSLLEAAERPWDPASVPDELRMEREIDISTTRGMAWCCYAEALNAAGRIAEAIVAYERATEHADLIPRKDILGHVLVGRVHILSLAGRGSEAAAIFRRAEHMLRNGRHELLLGKLYTNWGNACYQDDRHREAFRAYTQADRLLKNAAPEDTTRAVLLLNQAIVAAKLEQLDTAERLYERAEAMGRELGLGRLSAFALFNWALLKQARADYRSALRLLESAGSAFQALDSRDMSAAVLIARAEIYLDLGVASDAAVLAHDAARLFTAEKMTLDAVLAWIAEARCLAMLGDCDRALSLLREASAYFIERGNRPRQAQMLLHMAEVELDRNAPATSETYAQSALKIFSSSNMTHWVARSRMIAARAQLAAGRALDAEAMILPLLRRTASLPLNERQELWAVAGRVALGHGDLVSANRRLHRAVKLLEAARRLIPGTELRAHRFARQVQVYHDLIELELHRPRLQRLLELTERARARGFRDLASTPRRRTSKFSRSSR